MQRLTVLLVALPFLGCGSEGGGGLFGAGTQGTGASGSASTSGGGSTGGFMTTSISASDADGDGSGDNSSTPDPSAGSSGEETGSPTTGLEPTSTSGDESGSTSTGSAGEESSSSSSSSSGGGDVADDGGDDGGMGGMQPADGMYSPCTIPRDCGFAPELCITLSDMDGMVLDGFCSETTCNNPAVDCDPSPGGTAPPACLDVNVDGMADTACVLDCTGGATCPTGMTCYNLGAISICG